MTQSTKTIVHDRELGLEAYHFTGLVQPFPSHFHEHYVIGLMEGGTRQTLCNQTEYTAQPGDLLIFHPGEPHSCTQSSGLLDYRALNIPQERMARLAGELTGQCEPPRFTENVLRDAEASCGFQALHKQIMARLGGLQKEENLYFLLSLLFQKYSSPFETVLPDCSAETDAVIAYMKDHFSERVTLDQLCRYAGLSKSTLLRAFTRAKGMTPYRYLEAIRVNHARQLLENGASPAEAALRSGFSDQSHFTGYFSRFIGLSPGIYRDIFRSGHENGGAPQ